MCASATSTKSTPATTASASSSPPPPAAAPRRPRAPATIDQSVPLAAQRSRPQAAPPSSSAPLRSPSSTPRPPPPGRGAEICSTLATRSCSTARRRRPPPPPPRSPSSGRSAATGPTVAGPTGPARLSTYRLGGSAAAGNGHPSSGFTVPACCASGLPPATRTRSNSARARSVSRRMASFSVDFFIVL